MTSLAAQVAGEMEFRMIGHRVAIAQCRAADSSERPDENAEVVGLGPIETGRGLAAAQAW